ncbi:MAG TPA: hypothetical protein DIS53_02695 [Candidatus Wildermuthbacteria bacterium]|uniref:Uncharacterized protein n=1 Tax=Candidatus Yanofskybacteria bacterium GW2011_GWC1_48_11 TaxID=1619027 RepID=A0A837IKP0_9BACT|nr:MAG: hypothetical protein UY25_C0004G0022 [Candidatus Yanofskybacteria bacterium GW2011_GWC1_48_11]KKW04542.1 MAG: hypothetical protein UY38_C0001G0109 [Parcubacteria group bacterium GW2011_GWB1_49_12]KKW09200.1 MAG: hypothetical protein UY45_C0001G0086 [Parcubacteria group bacterium GW2011_GWA1_49_26]KKW14163.1 MAG: hypothetical protein UY53_C0003G0083 [Parcubacteria group bacterium GW2011_GWA2_50_10]OHA61451.1 MAG: hypothetical protein A2109_01055 [Candidatus Wildermuthbacteria bacterium G
MKKIKIAILVVLGVIALFVLVQIINASKYDMVVNVVEGENVVGVNPLTERLDFGDLSRNGRLARQVSVANGGGIDTYVMVWTRGELSDLVRVDPNFFIVAPGQEAKISLEVRIPPSAETRKYEGKVWVFRIPKPI